MTTFADLHRAVQMTIAGKRIGKPVFVHYLVQGADTADVVPARLARIVATVQEWLGQPLERVYAIGTADAGQVSLTVEGREGGSALISFARGPAGDASVDLTVLGNHGAIYHTLGNEERSFGEEAGKPPDSRILTAVERSLRSSKPEPLGTGGVP
jgi:hypothetical protein